MIKTYSIDEEIVTECLHTSRIGFYFVKFLGSDLEINTYKENIVSFEPAKEGEWKEGLVGMHINEDNGDHVIARISDCLTGRILSFGISKENIFF